MGENRKNKSMSTYDLSNSEQKSGIKQAARANPLLRQARKKHTLSQGDLAERIGVAKETISRWENGVSRPQPQQLQRLCEAFQMTPEELGYGLDHEENGSYPSQEATLALPYNSPVADSATPIKQPILTRRRVIVAGGTAVAGLSLAGGMLWWFSSRSTPLASPRYWPTSTYDLHHHTPLARVVQRMLQARQYDIGSTGADGIFGPITQFAVKSFQKDHHLTDDGIVNGPTWEVLIMPSDPGSRGSQVSALQEMLQTFHLLPESAADGEFGPQTTDAVRRFRQQHHLQVKDVADLDTWCLLVGGTLSK